VDGVGSYFELIIFIENNLPKDELNQTSHTNLFEVFQRCKLLM